MTKKLRRFLGTVSYEAQNQDLFRFFGRDLETERIDDSIYPGGISVIAGASGSGKTSLVNISLLHRYNSGDCRAEGFFAVRISLREYMQAKYEDFGRYIEDCIVDAVGLADHVILHTSDKKKDKSNSSNVENICEILDEHEIRNDIDDQSKNLILVFDQFESLFYADRIENGTKVSSKILEEVSILINPQSDQYLEDKNFSYKRAPAIVISIVDSELGRLGPLLDEYADLAANIVWVTGLSKSRAIKVIKELVSLPNCNELDLEFEPLESNFDDDLIGRIVDGSFDDSTLDISPFFLQLNGKWVEEKLIEGNKNFILNNSLGTGFSSLMESHYEDTLKSIEEEFDVEHRVIAATLCEKELVTLDGKPRSIDLDSELEYIIEGHQKPHIASDQQKNNVASVLEKARIIKYSAGIGKKGSLLKLAHSKVLEAVYRISNDPSRAVHTKIKEDTIILRNLESSLNDKTKEVQQLQHRYEDKALKLADQKSQLDDLKVNFVNQSKLLERAESRESLAKKASLLSLVLSLFFVGLGIYFYNALLNQAKEELRLTSVENRGLISENGDLEDQIKDNQTKLRETRRSLTAAKSSIRETIALVNQGLERRVNKADIVPSSSFEEMEKLIQAIDPSNVSLDSAAADNVDSLKSEIAKTVELHKSIFPTLELTSSSPTDSSIKYHHISDQNYYEFQKNVENKIKKYSKKCIKEKPKSKLLDDLVLVVSEGKQSKSFNLYNPICKFEVKNDDKPKSSYYLNDLPKNLEYVVGTTRGNFAYQGNVFVMYSKALAENGESLLFWGTSDDPKNLRYGAIPFEGVSDISFVVESSKSLSIIVGTNKGTLARLSVTLGKKNIEVSSIVSIGGTVADVERYDGNWLVGSGQQLQVRSNSSLRLLTRYDFKSSENGSQIFKLAPTDDERIILDLNPNEFESLNEVVLRKSSAEVVELQCGEKGRVTSLSITHNLDKVIVAGKDRKGIDIVDMSGDDKRCISAIGTSYIDSEHMRTGEVDVDQIEVYGRSSVPAGEYGLLKLDISKSPAPIVKKLYRSNAYSQGNVNDVVTSNNVTILADLGSGNRQSRLAKIQENQKDEIGFGGKNDKFATVAYGINRFSQDISTSLYVGVRDHGKDLPTSCVLKIDDFSKGLNKSAGEIKSICEAPDTEHRRNILTIDKNISWISISSDMSVLGAVSTSGGLELLDIRNPDEHKEIAVKLPQIEQKKLWKILFQDVGEDTLFATIDSVGGIEIFKVRENTKEELTYSKIYKYRVIPPNPSYNIKVLDLDFKCLDGSCLIAVPIQSGSKDYLFHWSIDLSPKLIPNLG